MTDANRPMNDVPALVEERHRYESWLAALDARRESTPKHVFDRVKADYTGRLQRVEEQLAAHRQSILEERNNLQSRRSLLEAEEQLRRDERAELELRAHVGELVGDESDVAFKAVDEALGSLRGERETLETRIRELDALLNIRPTGPAATPPQPTEAIEEQVSVPIAEVARTTPTTPPAPAGGHVSEPAQGKQPGLRTPGGSFDELAFLSEVVGKGPQQPADASADVDAGLPMARVDQVTGAITREATLAETLGESVRAAQATSTEQPLARNVSSNTPIVLRATAQAEQNKSLKCSECGAMNYPTEWYCERCGAELAAL